MHNYNFVGQWNSKNSKMKLKKRWWNKSKVFKIQNNNCFGKWKAININYKLSVCLLINFSCIIYDLDVFFQTRSSFKYKVKLGAYIICFTILMYYIYFVRSVRNNGFGKLFKTTRWSSTIFLGKLYRALGDTVPEGLRL